MSWITGLVGVLKPDGTRADGANYRGQQQPVVLKLPVGSNPTSRDLGNGTTEVTFELGDATAVPEYATLAAARAATPPANGTLIRIVTPPGEFRYSSGSGAGFADDGRTILKPDSVLLASNGRYFSTRASATVPTFDALRGLRGSNQDHVHVQAHTTFGDGGGGIFDRAAIGSYVDDGGTVATAGSNAWVRRDAANGHALLTWWGADPTGTVAADTAFTAANTWQQIAPSQRSIHVPDGTFRLDAVHDITGNNYTLTGNGRTSILRRVTKSPTVSLFRFTVAIAALKIRGINVIGDGDGVSDPCGLAVFDLTTGGACWYGFDVDISIHGGWQYSVFASGTSTTRGAFQWGRLGLQINMEAPQLYGNHGIYTGGGASDGGYFNACQIHIDAYNLRGTALYLRQMPDYPGGGYALRVSGSAQGCGRGFHLIHGNKTRFVDWAEEANRAGSILDSTDRILFENCEVGGLSQIAATRTRFVNTNGEIAEDADTYGAVYPESVSGITGVIARVNMSSHGGGMFASSGHSWATPAGFGEQDPPNIVLGGDMARFVSASVIWGSTGSYVAEKCGDGCTDTTAPTGGRFSALISGSVPGSTWYQQFRIAPPLGDEWLHCPVTATLKFRMGTGTDEPAMAITQTGFGGVASVIGPSGFAPIACEDGWTYVTMATRITADMLTNGISVTVYGRANTEFYLADVSGHLAYEIPRAFSRCEQSPFYRSISVTSAGLLRGESTGTPAITTDPVFSQALIDGDYLVETAPTIETNSGGLSFMTTGYVRNSSAWHSVCPLIDQVGVP